MTITLGLPEIIIGGLLIAVLTRIFYISYLRNNYSGFMMEAAFGAFATFLEVIFWMFICIVLLVIYGGIRLW